MRLAAHPRVLVVVGGAAVVVNAGGGAVVVVDVEAAVVSAMTVDGVEVVIDGWLLEHAAISATIAVARNGRRRSVGKARVGTHRRRH